MDLQVHDAHGETKIGRCNILWKYEVIEFSTKILISIFSKLTFKDPKELLKHPVS